MIKEIRRLLAYLKYIVLREEVQDGEIEKKNIVTQTFSLQGK